MPRPPAPPYLSSRESGDARMPPIPAELRRHRPAPVNTLHTAIAAARWTLSKKGNPTTLFEVDGMDVRVTIGESQWGWWYCLVIGSDDAIFPPGNLPTKDEAQRAAFDDLADRLRC